MHGSAPARLRTRLGVTFRPRGPHAYAHAHAQRRAYAHTRAHAHTHTHTNTHAHPHPHAPARARTRTRTHTHRRTRACTRTPLSAHRHTCHPAVPHPCLRTPHCTSKCYHGRTTQRRPDHPTCHPSIVSTTPNSAPARDAPSAPEYLSMRISTPPRRRKYFSTQGNKLHLDRQVAREYASRSGNPRKRAPTYLSSVAPASLGRHAGALLCVFLITRARVFATYLSKPAGRLDRHVRAHFGRAAGSRGTCLSYYPDWSRATLDKHVPSDTACRFRNPFKRAPTLQSRFQVCFLLKRSW